MGGLGGCASYPPKLNQSSPFDRAPNRADAIESQTSN
jgi:hypothetical protein